MRASYFFRRTLITIPTLIAISFVIFAIISLAPGDPLAEFAANPEVPAEVRENIKRSYGLDKPWTVRYVLWITSLVFRGEWGFSFASKMAVSELIQQRMPQTILVVGVAYALSVIIAIPVGVISAARPRSKTSGVISAVTMVGISLPTFLTGILLILIFSVNLKWFPMIYDTTLTPGDPDYLSKQFKQSIMPIMVLALFNAGALTRYVRSAMLDNLSSDYARTARSKGLAEWTVVIKHVLRNSMIPVVTLIAISLPAVFTGAIITEQIFRVNGIGELLINSIQRSDTPVVMGIVFIYAVLVVICGLLADMMYGILDPRIKLT